MDNGDTVLGLMTKAGLMTLGFLAVAMAIFVGSMVGATWIIVKMIR